MSDYSPPGGVPLLLALAANKPTAANAGKSLFKATDTNEIDLSDASVWEVLNPGGAGFVREGASENVLATAATVLTSTSVVGDTNDRFEILADGTMQWGSGTGAADIQLSRPQAGWLRAQPPGGGAGVIDAGSGFFLASNFFEDSLASGFKLSGAGIIQQGAVIAANASTAAAKIQAAASQTADLLDILASDGVTKNAFFTSAGYLGIGSGVAPTSTFPVDIRIDQNASTVVQVRNLTNGVNADAFFQANVGPSTGAYFGMASAGYTVAPIFTNRGFAGSVGGAGMVVATGDAQPLLLGINNAEVARFTTTKGLTLSNGSYAGGTDVGGTLSYGTGAPVNADGSNGDIYFRVDGGAGTTIYQRRAGAWVGIV